MPTLHCPQMNPFAATDKISNPSISFFQRRTLSPLAVRPVWQPALLAGTPSRNLVCPILSLDWGLPWQISECALDDHERITWRGRIWIPFHEPLRTSIIQQIHDSSLAGHPGNTITRDLVSRSYTWAGLTDDVRRFVSNCSTCGRGKSGVNRNVGSSNLYQSPTDHGKNSP